MAVFCTKCGTELPDDTPFCTACGASQAVAPAPTATPVAFSPAEYQAPQTEYQAPQTEYQAPQTEYQAPQTEYQAVPLPTTPPYSAPYTPPSTPPYSQPSAPPYSQPSAPPYSQPAAPPYAQPYAQPVPPPPSGGSAVKIILIVVGVLVGLGILVVCIFAFTIWRVSKAVHVEGNGSKVSIGTPGGGHVSVNSDESYSASDLGTAIYPGATKGQGGMKMDLPTGSMATAIFITSDSKDKVLAFYKGKFGSNASIMDTPQTAIITLKKGENEAVMVTITADKGANDSQTQIGITHTKKTGN